MKAFLETKIPSDWPAISTLREFCTFYFHLNGVPRRYFFQLLSFFATTDEYTEKLKEIAGSNEEYMNYCYRPKRTFSEVLQDFPCRIPLNYFWDLLPEIRPRSFSIASSNCLFPSTIHLTVGIVQYKTLMKVPRVGVCTQYMQSWEEQGN